MPKIQIDEFITNYLGCYAKHKESIDSREARNDATLKEFYSRFDVKKMTIRDYCFEKGNDSSYCYWIDYQLNDLCDLHVTMTGAFQKFHIQRFGNGYKFLKKDQKNNWAGLDEDTVFKNVKKEIIAVINASKQLTEENITTIEKSRLYEPFKAKLTYIYSPDLWMPILVKNDIDRILTAFGITVPNNYSLTRKRLALYEFYKTLVDKGLALSPWHFMRFLYSEEGYRDIVKGPNSKPSSIKKNPTGNNGNSVAFQGTIFKNVCFEELNSLESSKILLNESDDAIDLDAFLKSERRKKAVGLQGEIIIGHYLRKNKKALGITKIDAPCEKKQHNKHYDFSYQKNGDIHYIEVKSSSSGNGSIHFEMSIQEFLFMNKCISLGYDYKIYYVSNVFGTPIIKSINPNSIIDKLQSIKYGFFGHSK